MLVQFPILKAAQQRIGRGGVQNPERTEKGREKRVDSMANFCLP
jgi:hypothetical protein